MNQELLNKHIVAFNDGIKESLPKLAKDGSNAADFFTADVIGGRKFVQNYGGYPRSEIAEINAAANLQIQSDLLSRLTDFSDGKNPNSGLTDAQIMMSHKSKYQQAPNEIQEWLQGQIAIRDNMRYEMVKKAAAEKAAKKAAEKPAAPSVSVEPE